MSLRHARSGMLAMSIAIGAAVLLWWAQPARAAILDAPWSGSGTGTTTVASDGTTSDPEFDYNATAFSGSWTFSAVAGSARSVPVAYDSSGFYSYFMVTAGLQAFIQRNGVDVSATTLVNAGPANCCDPPSGGFDYKGTYTFADLQQGDTYGFRLTGSNQDGAQTLQGSLKLSEIDSTPPDVSVQVSGPQGANGFYNGPVSVAWTVSDDGSRIASAVGCGSAAVTADTPGTTLTCTAKSAGGTTTKSVTIKKDATPPDLTVPATLVWTATRSDGAVLTFAPAVTDAIDPAPRLSCTPPSGSRFAVGDAKVSCTATDAAGNSITKSFDAVVFPPPTLTFRATVKKGRGGTTRLTQLTLLNAPSGATVTVACQGRTCPKGLKGAGATVQNLGPSLSLGRFVKAWLATGTKVSVTTKGPTIVTTTTTLTMRKGKPPRASTACLPAGAASPTAC
jgi:hypothetical protein